MVAVAEIVVVPFVPPIAVATAEVRPAGIETVLETVPTAVSKVLKLTVRPPTGAGSEIVTRKFTC